MGFEIENVPLSAKIKWPFAEMQVGQSFVIEEKYVQRCYNAAYGYGLRHGMKFTLRKVNGVYRCGRIS